MVVANAFDESSTLYGSGNDDTLVCVCRLFQRTRCMCVLRKERPAEASFPPGLHKTCCVMPTVWRVHLGRYVEWAVWHVFCMW